MEGYTGYKYSKAGNEIYIIKLRCFNEFANPLYKDIPVDFFTTDCIVEEIKNANTGEIVTEIKGKAWYPFKYESGKRITGTSIYYCKMRVELFSVYLCKNLKGRIISRMDDFMGNGLDIFPGVASAISLFLKCADNSESLIDDLHRFLLYAEKKYFPDESRTIEEALHIDPFPFEAIPQEFIIEGLSQSEMEAKWAEYRALFNKKSFMRGLWL